MIRQPPFPLRTVTRTALKSSKGPQPPLAGTASVPLPVGSVAITRTAPRTQVQTSLFKDQAPQHQILGSRTSVLDPQPTVAGTEFTPAQSALGAFCISRQRLKRLEAITLIREQREQHKQELAFNARPFVLCGIPLRRPPRGQLTYARHNGRHLLKITAHPDFGLPFGQDRLIPIWVATLSVQQKSRAIHFSSAAEILDFFDLPKDGPHYRRMVEGFQRVFAATIFFGTRRQVKGATFIEMARFQFFDCMKLWFNTEQQNTRIKPESFENTIMLSEAFYNEINAHPIPVERTVISALANAPGMLDFYMWLVWRSWTIRSGSISVPLVAERGLNVQLGSKNYTEPRYFRAKVRTWLKQVKVLWPECPAYISFDGCFIEIRSSRANPPIPTSPNAKKL